jgi:hypothetical protein
MVHKIGCQFWEGIDPLLSAQFGIIYSPVTHSRLNFATVRLPVL